MFYCLNIIQVFFGYAGNESLEPHIIVGSKYSLV